MVNQQQSDDSKQALNKAIWDTNEILVTASTVSPIHKNTLTLNRAKLYAEKRQALGAVDLMSVRVEDVLNVTATIGPLSGFIKITTKFTAQDKPYTIGPFRRRDTVKLKRIIQGYVLALQRKIDLNLISSKELIPMLYELGVDDHSIR